MTDSQIRLVRDSFRQVTRMAESASTLFYWRLFEFDPDLRQLFKGDMTEQGRELMEMLGAAVKRLERPEQLLPAVRVLSAHRAAYGVREQDHETVGRALLATLRHALGEAFTPALEAAWVEVSITLAGVTRAVAVSDQ